MMNIYDCGGPLSRRLIKVDGAWGLELENIVAELLNGPEVGS
jgi:hypothetical protein